MDLGSLGSRSFVDRQWQTAVEPVYSKAGDVGSNLAGSLQLASASLRGRRFVERAFRAPWISPPRGRL